MTLSVPADLLPSDRRRRHARLRDYFCDKDAHATFDDGRWRLDLRWPGEPDRHVDGRIVPALEAWDGIGLSEMSTARRRSGRVLTALYDTWTLPSWSEWASRVEPSADETITILHLDDHHDLGSPRLALEPDGSTRDLITGRPFYVRDPVSVEAACASGAVGMGSFLTPFLLAFPRCDVRQLGQAPKVTGTKDSLIVPTTVEDDLLRPGARRPAVVLRPLRGGGAGQGRYRVTDDIDALLAGIGPGPVLLHIDMDYFNNRYDGDGDWPDRFPRHDPPLASVLERIGEVTQRLRRSNVLSRVEDAVIAFSPGFFPAELWQPAERRLREGLEELYD